MAAAIAFQGPRAARAARGQGRPEGASPAAQALAPGKTSRFLQLFRKLVTGARAAPAAGQTRAAGQEPVRRKGQEQEPAGEPPVQGARLRPAAARRSRQTAAAAGEREAAAAVPAASASAGPASGPRRAEAAAALAAPAEARRGERPAQPRLVVVDLRARPVEAEKQAESRRSSPAPAPEGQPRSFERVLLAREAGADAGPSLQRPAAGSAPASQPAPAPLGERLVPEIVHQAGIILKNGDEGEIRLVLKPEHLGSVRIRLQLGESSLEGRIVVDNGNVKELLDSHLEQLKSALRQEGWASANINVTVSGGDSGRRDQPPDAYPLPAVAETGAGDFERATPAMLDLGFTTVNLLA